MLSMNKTKSKSVSESVLFFRFLITIALSTVGLLLIAALIAIWLYRRLCHGPLPHLDPEEWWSAEELRGSNDTSVRPFKIEFSEEIIADLKHRLKTFRSPPPPLEDAFQNGFNSDQLEPWRRYWAEVYDFKERERFLNQFPQYKTNVQGLDIHFIRVKPEPPPGVAVYPLLILHGWPGSVREFYEIIPLLTTRHPGHEFVFEVVAPSLPGFGYSDVKAATRPGLGGPQIAVILRNLMHRLGHRKFYMQAGDWGAEIATDLATLYPEEVLGFHTNLPVVKHPFALLLTALGAVIPWMVVDAPMYDRMNRFSMLARELGYFYIQATKPDTLGVALTDSPLGLLAYILEKTSIATNYHYLKRPDGGLEDKFTKDQLLDNLMIYWASKSITSALRLYREGLKEVFNKWSLNVHPTPVRTWVLQAKYEILYQTPRMLRFKFPNLVDVTVLQKGGHFIAFEAPKVLVKDIFTAVDAFRRLKKD